MRRDMWSMSQAQRQPSSNVVPLRSIASSLDSIPQHDRDTEAAVIGAMIVNAQARTIAAEQLRPDDFYIQHHRRLFSGLQKATGAVDELIVRNSLKRQGLLDSCGGPDAVAFLVDSARPASVEALCAEILRLSGKRRLEAVAHALATESRTPAESEAVKTALEELHDVQNRLTVTDR